ncbi:hypothetical protein F5Y15DRAFT_398882 [Xylariaceae sp. FL0016]|nr:hypothetical protein F5Y15DRAFT_398882 [Xylariaceae sp. FL0016]
MLHVAAVALAIIFTVLPRTYSLVVRCLSRKVVATPPGNHSDLITMTRAWIRRSDRPAPAWLWISRDGEWFRSWDETAQPPLKTGPRLKFSSRQPTLRPS